MCAATHGTPNRKRKIPKALKEQMCRKPTTEAERDRVKQVRMASEGHKDRGRDKESQSARGTGMSRKIEEQDSSTQDRRNREKLRKKSKPGESDT